MRVMEAGRCRLRWMPSGISLREAMVWVVFCLVTDRCAGRGDGPLFEGRGAAPGVHGGLRFPCTKRGGQHHDDVSVLPPLMGWHVAHSKTRGLAAVYCVLQKTYRGNEDHYNWFLSPCFTAAASYGQAIEVVDDELVIWVVRLTWLVST